MFTGYLSPFMLYNAERGGMMAPSNRILLVVLTIDEEYLLLEFQRCKMIQQDAVTRVVKRL